MREEEEKERYSSERDEKEERNTKSIQMRDSCVYSERAY